MTAQAKKEFRVLLPSWSMAMLAAFYLPVVTTLAGRMHRPNLEGLLLEWTETLTGVCVLVACLAMAAMSFGVEIHQRTFGLMLAQPVQRSRIWWSKMSLLAGSFISVGVAFVAGQCVAHAAWGSSFKSWSGHLLLFVPLLAGVMCSSAFWTLQSRSIIGGMVLPLGMQALLAIGINYFASGTSWILPEKHEPRLFMALGVGAFVYCVLFTYLSWWKFSRLEWREAYAGESVIGALPALRVKVSQHAAPRSPWSSLLRKELRLHRPVFSLAALFVACWIAALGLKALHPAWEVRGVFGMILVIYLPLAWLLSGCISLGEEKQLGTWGWHLTLPVSGARQWAVKISFALLMVLILGILMPAMALLAAQAPGIQIFEKWTPGASLSPALLVSLAAVLCTILSFWSVTMSGTVVRAVLFTFLGAGVFLFGGVMMLRIGHETRLLQGFCSWIMVEFQLPPYDVIFSNWFIAAGWFIGLSLLLALLLRQSYACCRREPSPRTTIRCSLILVISLFLPLWLSSDITQSCWWSVASLRFNFSEAIAKLPESIREDVVEKSRPVSLEEIDRTGMLHPETRRWLRGASIRINQPFTYAPRSRPLVPVAVTFPDGRYFVTVLPW